MSDADGPFGAPDSDDVHVTQRLRQLPRDITMPRDVSIRIAAAIESEAQAAQERGTLADPESAPSRAPEPRGWFRRRAPRLLAGAAGIGVVMFGVFLATGGDGAHEDATAGAGDAAEDLGAQEHAESSGPSMTGPMVERAPADSEVEQFAAPADPDLSELVSSIASTGAEFEPGCGTLFADTIDAELLGSAAIDGSVLVVTTVEDTATAEGWTLDSCGAAQAMPHVDPVVVPRPAP